MKTKYRVIADGEKLNGCIFYKKSETDNLESALSMYEKLKNFIKKHNLSDKVTVTLFKKCDNAYFTEKSTDPKAFKEKGVIQ